MSASGLIDLKANRCVDNTAVVVLLGVVKYSCHCPILQTLTCQLLPLKRGAKLLQLLI